MKRTILTLICGIALALSVNAQGFTPQQNRPPYGQQPPYGMPPQFGQQIADRPPFGQEKFYVSTALTGFDLNYDKNSKWKLGVLAKAGYLFDDNWMVMAKAEYDYQKNIPNTLKLGTGLRYYIEQNGLYLGLGANYVHQNHNFDDFMPEAHLGYAFFLNRTVTIEPELYYNHSFKDSDYSNFGLRIGFGIYFE